MIATKPDESSLRKSSLSQDEFHATKGFQQLQETSLIGEQKYNPTKIKLWHVWEPAEQILNHPIQVLFESYNEFIKILFTQRTIYETTFKQRLPLLLKLAKKIGLTLLKGQLQPVNLKIRENSNLLKERIWQCWCKIISLSNSYEIETASIFDKKIDEKTK